MRRRLEWLGHLARMPQYRLPKLCLFGWLPAVRPFKGPRRRWRDQVRKDMEAVGCYNKQWFRDAQDRCKWRDTWSQPLQDLQLAQDERRSQAVKEIECQTCGRFFRRQSDKVRHKCIEERRKPVNEQSGAVQCMICNRWFRSKGGLAVHRCTPNQ